MVPVWLGDIISSPQSGHAAVRGFPAQSLPCTDSKLEVMKETQELSLVDLWIALWVCVLKPGATSADACDTEHKLVRMRKACFHDNITQSLL
jgi:hypothetical protein